MFERLAQFAEGELFEFFMLKSRAKHESVPANIHSARSVALHAVNILTELAAAGNDDALRDLKRFADEMSGRAGHALRVAKSPATAKTSSLPGAVSGPALEKKQPGIVASASEQPWHDLLGKVLRSGEQTAIEAVQKNLEVFSRYVDVGLQPGQRDRLPQTKAARKAR
jgi:hypothetical protein